MKTTVQYNGKTDRAQRVAENEALGLRMLHDDFAEGWQRGDDPSGTLTFTDEPGVEAPEIRVRDLKAEIDELRAEISEMKKNAARPRTQSKLG